MGATTSSKSACSLDFTYEEISVIGENFELARARVDEHATQPVRTLNYLLRS